MIGLETMPRTMDNIGFYSALGFVPGRLTITLTLDAASGDRAARAARPTAGCATVRTRSPRCRALVERLAPGYDFTREIELTESLALGDTVLVRDGAAARRRSRSATPRRSWKGARARSCACSSSRWPTTTALDAMLRALCDFAKRSGTRRVALRVQGEYPAMYRALVALGARVRWTDLRMALGGYEERRAGSGIMLSNWEI